MGACSCSRVQKLKPTDINAVEAPFEMDQELKGKKKMSPRTTWDDDISDARVRSPTILSEITNSMTMEWDMMAKAQSWDRRLIQPKNSTPRLKDIVESETSSEPEKMVTERQIDIREMASDDEARYGGLMLETVDAMTKALYKMEK